MATPGSSSRLLRLPLVLAVGVVLCASACKSVDDLPDKPPVDDDWVDQIEAEEPAPVEGEVATAPVGAEEPAPAEVAADDSTAPAEGETAVAADAVAMAEAEAEGTVATQVVASPKPSAGGSGSGSNSGGSAAASASDAETEPAPEDAAEVATAPSEPTPEAAPKPAAKPEEPPAPKPITMADYAGTFKFTGGNDQREKLAAAIEDAAMQVNAMIRGIARKRLTKTQILETPLEISITGNTVRFDLGTTGGSWSAEIDGPTTTMKYNGDKYKVNVRSKDGKMITTFFATDATKTIVYALSSDRKRLTVHHRLVADQLKTPVTFKFSYTRQ